MQPQPCLGGENFVANRTGVADTLMHVLVMSDKLIFLVEPPATLVTIKLVVLQVYVAHVAFQAPRIGKYLVAQFAVIYVFLDVDSLFMAFQSALVQCFKGAHITEELSFLMVAEMSSEFVLRWVRLVAQRAS